MSERVFRMAEELRADGIVVESPTGADAHEVPQAPQED